MIDPNAVPARRGSLAECVAGIAAVAARRLGAAVQPRLHQTRQLDRAAVSVATGPVEKIRYCENLLLARTTEDHLPADDASSNRRPLDALLDAAWISRTSTRRACWCATLAGALVQRSTRISTKLPRDEWLDAYGRRGGHSSRRDISCMRCCWRASAPNTSSGVISLKPGASGLRHRRARTRTGRPLRHRHVPVRAAAGHARYAGRVSARLGSLERGARHAYLQVVEANIRRALYRAGFRRPLPYWYRISP